jgi:hypothetical protein
VAIEEKASPLPHILDEEASAFERDDRGLS